MLVFAKPLISPPTPVPPGVVVVLVVVFVIDLLLIISSFNYGMGHTGLHRKLLLMCWQQISEARADLSSKGFKFVDTQPYS